MIWVLPPKQTTNRCGAAILCQELLGLIPVANCSGPEGQFAIAEVHGTQHFTIRSKSVARIVITPMKNLSLGMNWKSMLLESTPLNGCWA